MIQSIGSASNDAYEAEARRAQFRALMEQRQVVDICQCGAPAEKKRRFFLSMTKGDIQSWVGSSVQHGAEWFEDHPFEASGIAKLCAICCPVAMIS